MGTSNIDGLFRRYGTETAIPTTAGDYVAYGENRKMEFFINIADLTTSAAIIPYADTTFMAAGMFIDEVKVETVTAVATITSLSIGLMKLDRSTTISDTAFVAALPQASMDVAGETTVITGGTTYAGTKVGTTTGTDSGYLTAKIAGSTGTGLVKVIVSYRGVPPITR